MTLFFTYLTSLFLFRGSVQTLFDGKCLVSTIAYSSRFVAPVYTQ